MSAGGTQHVFCTNCGAQIAATATFCRHCGARQQQGGNEQTDRQPASVAHGERQPQTNARVDAKPVSGEAAGSQERPQPRQTRPDAGQTQRAPAESDHPERPPAESRQSTSQPQGPVDRKSLRRAGAILAIAIPNLAIGGSNSIYGEIGTGVVSRTVSDFSPLFLVGVVLALVGCAYLGTVTLRAVVWRLTGGETRSWRALGTVKGGLLLIAATGGAIVAWLALFGLSVMVFVPSPTV